MAGGKIRLLWDRDDAAEVNIYGAGGALATSFKENGSPITFPVTLDGDVTLVTTKPDTYSLSVTYGGVEIGAGDDTNRRVVPLINGEAELVVAPSPMASSFGSPVGADQTAYLTAIYVGDTSNTDHQLTLVADPRHGELPSWVTIVSGNAVLGEDAGACIAALAGQASIDYSATTAPDDPGASNAFYNIKCNGSTFATTATLVNGVTVAGTGVDVVALPTCGPDGGLIFQGTITAFASASATDAASAPINDGVATHSVAVTITRSGQSPVPA